MMLCKEVQMVQITPDYMMTKDGRVHIVFGAKLYIVLLSVLI